MTVPAIQTMIACRARICKAFDFTHAVPSRNWAGTTHTAPLLDIQVDGADYTPRRPSPRSAAWSSTSAPGSDGELPTADPRARSSGRSTKPPTSTSSSTPTPPDHAGLAVGAARAGQARRLPRTHLTRQPARRLAASRSCKHLAFSTRGRGDAWHRRRGQPRARRPSTSTGSPSGSTTASRASTRAFLDFIKGIQPQGDREWYASLMLNRLMFVYFIQKKGFLDGDPDYLRNRLRLHARAPRQGQVPLLLPLLPAAPLPRRAGPARARRSELDKLLGNVPVPQRRPLRRPPISSSDDTHIEIPDKAFEKHVRLLRRLPVAPRRAPAARDNEINPDVLGYIFEKYINQKQMGAYYTKEDITEYIGQNTMIPFLFDAAEKECAIAFRPDGALWRLLRDDPDRYIYAAVRTGRRPARCPPRSRPAWHDVTKRDGWNKPRRRELCPADRDLARTRRPPHALRGARAQTRSRRGHAHQRPDHLNLDIRQFAQDVIEHCEGPELLRAFYHAIEKHHRARPDLRLRRVPLRRPQHPGAAVRRLPRPDAGFRGRLTAPARTEAAPRESSPTSARCWRGWQAAPQPRLLHPQVDHPRTTCTAWTSWRRRWRSASCASSSSWSRRSSDAARNTASSRCPTSTSTSAPATRSSASPRYDEVRDGQWDASSTSTTPMERILADAADLLTRLPLFRRQQTELGGTSLPTTRRSCAARLDA